MSRSPSAGPPLRHLDQHTVAVALHTRSRSHVFCGRSTFHAVTDLGPILRITLESPEVPLEIILQERHWRGRIEYDKRFGCDYYLNCE